VKSKDQMLLEEAYDKVNEESSNEIYEEFIEKRMKGASKIATTAEEKGSFAALTGYHFKAKEKPYKDCFAKRENEDKEKYIKEKAQEAFQKLKNWDKMSQKEFQSLTGVFEVYGEVYIQSMQSKDYSNL